MEVSADIGCKCPACLESERLQEELELPYRYEAGRGQAVFHLFLHLFLPAAGMILIGWSWLALVPVIGFLAAYLFNSFFLCATCAYHHADARICGCYPKSVFSFKRYRGRPWTSRDNAIGRSLLIAITIGPAVSVLAVQGAGASVIVLLVAAIVVIFLTSVFSCPACRQRSFCALGRLTMANIRRT